MDMIQEEEALLLLRTIVIDSRTRSHTIQVGTYNNSSVLQAIRWGSTGER